MSKINALFIDPFRCEIRHCEVENRLDVWYKLLQCDVCEVSCIMQAPWGTRLDVWYDEEYLVRHQNMGPCFRFLPQKEGEQPLAISGYGLVCGASGGETVSVNEEGFMLTARKIKSLLGLNFEHWQRRLCTDDYIEQLLRTPETEPGLTGHFRYLDIPEESGKVRTS